MRFVKLYKDAHSKVINQFAYNTLSEEQKAKYKELSEEEVKDYTRKSLSRE